MFNIGFTELVILAIIALLVVGPEQLPDLAKKFAKLLNELKRAKEDIMSPVDDLRMQAQRAIEETRRKVDEQIQSDVVGIMNEINKKAKSAENEPSVTPAVEGEKKERQDG